MGLEPIAGERHFLLTAAACMKPFLSSLVSLSVRNEHMGSSEKHSKFVELTLPFLLQNAVFRMHC